MCQPARTLLLALAFPLLASGARALGPIRPAEAPRADPRLLRALASEGLERVGVVIRMKDGTPSAAKLLASPDPEGEPARRERRLVAQRRLAAEIPAKHFEVRHTYESFSLLAGTATREGVRALANRPDVLSVTLDGVRRLYQASAPAATLALIRSPEANSLGFTGKSQTIAVLDTGVDYTLPLLGGGAFPNGKVIGGTDTSDGDGDPMDCAGHGTSVAAIIASAEGVAPDAKIVAIKVFPGCEGGTFLSDILAGIDFAIVNRSRFNISAINMSLGGPIGEAGTDLGYCDALDPESAAAVDAAVAAGLAVFVASGNEAQSNALSTPACLSSAVSVGAVYSAREIGFDWFGFCADPERRPDGVVCFSNSTSNLSLLAPGAFWDIPTAGGRRDSFSGTSAASPAAAGVFALLREARPNLLASALVGALAMTGKPVGDARNGVLTPRVDALSAVDFAAVTFGSSGGAAVPIPDGAGTARATASVSGFTGTLGAVRAWVQLDHPDPRQLVVSITGPDGTRVVVHDRTGQRERPLNAVFGVTHAPANPLSAFQGKQANGAWALTVEDQVAGLAGRIRNFAVVPVRGQPSDPLPRGAAGAVLPAVRRTEGGRGQSSDLRLYNPGPLPATFRLFYVPMNLGGAQAVRATRTIEPGRVLALDDFLSSEFGHEASSGHLTVLSSGGGFLASSRTSKRRHGETFGFFAGGILAASGIAFGEGTASLNGLSRLTLSHTDLGFTEVSGSPVTVRIDLKNRDGSSIGSLRGIANANQTTLVPDIIKHLGLGSISNFRADFTVTSTGGRIVPFAAAADDATGDEDLEAAALALASAEDIVVSRAVFSRGAGGETWKTELRVSNLGTEPATFTLSLLPGAVTGVPGPARVYTLAPGETLVRPEALRTEFGLSEPSMGAVRVRPAAAARLLVSARTLADASEGRFGSSASGTPVSEAIGAADGGTLTAIHLDQSAAGQQRASFGVVEVEGSSLTVRVTARSGATGEVLASADYTLAGATSLEASAAELLGVGTAAANFYLQFTPVSGSGRIVAYVVASDTSSGDAAQIPARREP